MIHLARLLLSPFLTFVDGHSKRTLLDILWGCISTTIICGWTVVHPNMPPREGPFKVTLRKLELVLWTIVSPEGAPAIALNQLLGAMIIRDLYNRKKGMLSHPFKWICSRNKVRLQGVMRDLEDREEMVFVVRDKGGRKSRWVFEWHL